MALTLYSEIKLTDHLLGIAAFTMPTGSYLGLHTASPGEAGSLAAEVSTSGTGYSRIDVAGKFSAASALTGVSILNATINRGPATADWGTLTHFSLHDAATGGNMLAYGTFSEAQTILTGQTFQRVAGQLQLRLD